jgi:hypothetical protein
MAPHPPDGQDDKIVIRPSARPAFEQGAASLHDSSVMHGLAVSGAG